MGENAQVECATGVATLALGTRASSGEKKVALQPEETELTSGRSTSSVSAKRHSTNELMAYMGGAALVTHDIRYIAAVQFLQLSISAGFPNQTKERQHYGCRN